MTEDQKYREREAKERDRLVIKWRREARDAELKQLVDTAEYCHRIADEYEDEARKLRS